MISIVPKRYSVQYFLCVSVSSYFCEDLKGEGFPLQQLFRDGRIIGVNGRTYICRVFVLASYGSYLAYVNVTNYSINVCVFLFYAFPERVATYGVPNTTVAVVRRLLRILVTIRCLYRVIAAKQ